MDKDRIFIQLPSQTQKYKSDTKYLQIMPHV